MSPATSAPRTALVLLAAGAGTRVGAEDNKVLLPLAGRTALAWSLLAALEVPEVARLVLVVRSQDRAQVADLAAPLLLDREAWLVDGGATRHASEWAALVALRADIESGAVDVVAIHDTARPLATPDLFERAIAAAAAAGGAVPVVTVPGLVGRDLAAAPTDLAAMQTPQAFRAGPLLAAYAAAETSGFTGTDTAACLEAHAPPEVRPDIRIVAVAGSPENLKVTFPDDLPVAEALLSARTARATRET